MTRKHPKRLPRTLGVDTGGTFTDFVQLEGEEVRTEKVSSTPDDPSRAVLEGAERLGGADAGLAVVHGTTVALNAVLTGRLARTALVTNEGFRDLIEIGRQERPDLYALHPEKPAPVVPRARRFEVPQRSWPDPDGGGGLVEVHRPTRAELTELKERIRRSRAESIAVCLLHSYADPSIEERVAKALRGLGLPITTSAGVLPEYREHERFSTACVNAALVPLMRHYLTRLGASLGGARLSVMQSSGGTLPAEVAAIEPVRVLFSGPAGGVVGAARAAREAGFDALVAFDMGGTSTDVAFHSTEAGLLNAVTDGRIAGHPVSVPTLDIHTIGCGGGSVVHVDAGEVLHVGPQSAGADPGPACYGRGGELTVTDAHLFLGHIAPGTFLDGRLELDVEATQRGFERLAERLACRPVEAAEGVLEVARAAMRRAVGVMTMQRGQDPRRVPLVAFGGAGGLSAAALAGSLGMPGTLIPAHPGVLSAAGMAGADALRDRSRSVLAPLSEWPRRRRAALLKELGREGGEELRAEGFGPREIELEATADLRYAGQSFWIALPESSDLEEAFHARHEELYGYRLFDRPVELVGLRSRAVARRAARAPRSGRKRALPRAAVAGERRAVFAGRASKVPVLLRAALAPGHHFEGPALVEEFSGTTVVPPGWTARVTAGGHLWLAPR